MRITKIDCKNKQEINIEDYFMNRKIYKENMKEVDA